MREKLGIDEDSEDAHITYNADIRRWNQLPVKRVDGMAGA